jgi:uncharacterized protein YqeY
MLQTKLMQDMKEAMKEKDTLRKGVLILLRSGLINAEKEKRAELETDEELTVISRELKRAKESLFEFEKAGRDLLIADEKRKIEIIEQYLPKQMTEDDIVSLLDTMKIDKTQNTGRITGQVMPLVKGKADGTLVRKTIEKYVQS